MLSCNFRQLEERYNNTLFKKCDKEMPADYRAINLLSTTLKLTIKIRTNKINEHTSLADELQGFRSGR